MGTLSVRMFRKRLTAVRRSLHVDQIVTETATGARLVERILAKEEAPDGTVIETLRETIEDRDADSDWLSTGTVRTRTTTTKEAK
jgi:hypothetical protein